MAGALLGIQGGAAYANPETALAHTEGKEWPQQLVQPPRDAGDNPTAPGADCFPLVCLRWAQTSNKQVFQGCQKLPSPLHGLRVKEMPRAQNEPGKIMYLYL